MHCGLHINGDSLLKLYSEIYILFHEHIFARIP